MRPIDGDALWDVDEKSINDLPIWQLPDTTERRSADAEISPRVKYHCFVDGESLCKQYFQDNDFYEMRIDSGEILSNPGIACKRCRQLWIKRYGMQEDMA